LTFIRIQDAEYLIAIRLATLLTSCEETRLDLTPFQADQLQVADLDAEFDI
jgi:hypothetical protein